MKKRLRRERLKHGKPADMAAAIDVIVKRVAALPVLDDRTPGEIIGYYENDLPT